MSPSCAEILGRLSIYKRNYSEYTKCLSRDIEVLVSGRPEELVRQVLLYFLLCESRLFPDTIDVKTEYNNLDIVVYRRPTEEFFRPLQKPLAIIEVKREEANLLDYENQLFEYMKEQRGNTGVLFNGNEIIAYEKRSDGDFVKWSLNSLSDLGDLLQRLSSRKDPDIWHFQQARDGDIDSFIYLAQKYGKYTLHQFTFTLKDHPTPINGCCFRFQEQRVCYDIYGKYSLKKNFWFNRSEFDCLISIIY